MRISLSIETLQDAYDMCLLVKENSANVLASEPDSKADQEWYRKSKRFMDTFDKACASKPDRKKEREHWTKRLEDGLNKLNSQMDDLQSAVGEKV